MRKVVLTFGLIAGAVISVYMVIQMSLWAKGVISFDAGYVVGYAGMVIALSMVFFGIKSYRDNYLNGAIKFLKGLQVGLLISLVASLMYAATWEVYYQTNDEIRNTFMDKYTDHLISKMKNEGASQAEMDQKTKEMTDMKEMYQNPLIRFVMTLAEIFPVGILITLLSAAILRRREVLRA